MNEPQDVKGGEWVIKQVREGSCVIQFEYPNGLIREPILPVETGELQGLLDALAAACTTPEVVAAYKASKVEIEQKAGPPQDNPVPANYVFNFYGR